MNESRHELEHDEEYERVRVAVDIVIFTIRDDRLHTLLIERGHEPFLGRPALPGGFLRPHEDLDMAASRELMEETGVDGSTLHLEQLRSYGSADRDPRGRVVSVAYLALAPNLPVPVAGTDAAEARWEVVDAALSPECPLAFDHRQILVEGLERARAKLEYTTLATVFCEQTFTVGDLRQVYEAVWGTTIDPRNFHRKITNARGFVVPTENRRSLDTGRPATLYRRGPATNLYPPMLRDPSQSQ